MKMNYTKGNTALMALLVIGIVILGVTLFNTNEEIGRELVQQNETHTEEVAIEQTSHDHDGEAGESHEHEHETVEAKEPYPTISIEVSKDHMSGYNVQIETEEFKFAPESVGEAHKADVGHVHLYVDGKKVARVYGEWFHLTGLTKGEHVISATLNNNEHKIYTAEGENIYAETTVTVE